MGKTICKAIRQTGKQRAFVVGFTPSLNPAFSPRRRSNARRVFGKSSDGTSPMLSYP
jgi:hypothetical protein